MGHQVGRILIWEGAALAGLDESLFLRSFLFSCCFERVLTRGVRASDSLSDVLWIEYGRWMGYSRILQWFKLPYSCADVPEVALDWSSRRCKLFCLEYSIVIRPNRPITIPVGLDVDPIGTNSEHLGILNRYSESI